ncbi:Pilus assembly protein [Pararobbsia alpina]|uniref:TadE family protein n=1 Tax=Pararobbsia alpina TaxID=621374 RepID=UPI0039A668A3
MRRAAPSSRTSKLAPTSVHRHPVNDRIAGRSAARYKQLNELHAQRGVAAIEFAFVFPLFFVVLYAIVAYCLILCANMALSGATQEGARAALNNAAGVTTLSGQYTQRMANACSRANGLATWLTGATANTTCGQSTGQCPAGAASCTTVSQAPCGPSNAMVCVTVTMNYDYADHPIVPKLPLLGFVTPTNLGASSTVQLDPAAVMSNM